MKSPNPDPWPDPKKDYTGWFARMCAEIDWDGPECEVLTRWPAEPPAGVDPEIWRLINKYRSDADMPPIPPARLTFRQYVAISPTLQAVIGFSVGAVSMAALLWLVSLAVGNTR
jgi:hypothetical protein